jgi:putative endonuclease
MSCDCPYVCYVLGNANRTYCGTTNNMVRRLRQHNGEISGGARYTTAHNKHGRWTIYILVKGFSSRRDCLHFERRMKRTNGVQTRNSYERRLSVLANVTRAWMYELQVKTNFATELDAMRFAAEVVPWHDGANTVHAPLSKPQPSLTIPCPPPAAMADTSITDASAPAEVVAKGIRVVSYSLFWGPAKGRGYRGESHDREEYIAGIYQSIPVATSCGWVVRIHHDGNWDEALARFAACGRVEFVLCKHDTERPLAYFGALWRLLPADDDRVDVFLSRDADDPLHHEAMEVANRWVDDPSSIAHVQLEPYEKGVNMGWYGQKRINLEECVSDLIFEHATRCDRYAGDEDFLRETLLPIVASVGAITPMESHKYRFSWDYAPVYTRFLEHTPVEFSNLHVHTFWDP